MVFNDKIPEELFNRADTLRSEYVVGISGKVIEERIEEQGSSYRRISKYSQTTL